MYGEEFLPPADFGHYQTHWDRWPCNELTIDRGHRPDEQPKKKPTDTGSTPGDTTGAENEMNNEGVPGRKDDPDALPDDLFAPDRNAPLPNKTEETPPPDTTPDEPGLTPPDPNAPDAMPPDVAPTDEIPEVKPPLDATPIPDDLFEKPAGAPPGHGSLGTELPIDAPEGDLVSDGAETNRKKVAVEKKPNVVPTGPTLIPTTPRIESARRPSAIRRTSAIETLPRDKRDVFAEDESEGPNLQVPDMNRPSAAPPKTEASTWTRSVKGSAARNARTGRGAVATDSR